MANKVTVSQVTGLVSKLIVAIKSLFTDAVNGMKKEVAEKVNDAPADGVLYGRQNNTWVKVEQQAEDDVVSDDEFNAAVDKAIEDALKD